MNLGQSMSEMYDNPTSKKEKIYPEVSLPSKLFDKSYKIGDKCVIEFTGTIESMSKSGYRIKLIEGIEVESKEEEKKEESLLRKAK